MTATVTTFDPAWAAGARTGIGFAGVDSGTMCIATRFPADDSWMDAVDGAGWSGDGWACSTTGHGDGSYDVLTLTADDGTVTGVEVMFLSAAIDAAAALTAPAAPEPTDAQKQTIYDRTATAATRAAYDAWLAAAQTATNSAWEQLATTVDPTTESTPHLLGELTVTAGFGGGLGVGDPCYGSPTKDVDVPAGRYAAVAWTLGTTAGRTGTSARLGAYRIR